MADSRFVVLGAVDESDLGERIVRTAVTQAAVPNGELHLLHVVTRSGHTTPAERALGLDAGTRVTQARARLEKLALDASPGAVCHLAVGDPTTEILQMAAQLAADSIVVGTHGRRGLERVLLGSVAEHVVRMASCPVLVTRAIDYSAGVPAIEPPCTYCLEKQQASHGIELWCEAHARRHVHGNVHYEYPQTFAVGSMLLRPTNGAR
jgi:nucleotide-binding universal stress UspA family protein